MRDKILAALKKIEDKHDCRILFAVESGSRAWGFASPDSDYDVRAVYVMPLDWYLQINEPSTDTITEMLPGDLDVVAWDLRKFLQHLNKSNTSLFEWLGSPIVYADTGLLATLNAVQSECAEPARIAFHYASMFRHAMENRNPDGTISIKKLCYALRASLCVRWVTERHSMPPTSFADVRAGVSLSSRESLAIDRLLALKAGAYEADRVVPAKELDELLRDRFEELQAIRWPRRTATDALAELTRIFRGCVKCLSMRDHGCSAV